MPFSKKAAALAAGFITTLSAVTLAQNVAAGGRGPATSAETLVIDDATVDWIEKSDVAALLEGVIDRMELQVGMPVQKGKPIGYLHSELAALNLTKAEVAVRGTATQAKAIAQKELAMARVATDFLLNRKVPGSVSSEELRKDEAEVKVADAMEKEAIEKRELDKAERDVAKRTLEEHTIVAPFDGVVVDRMKNPGESVRAHEPVIRLGNLDKLRAWFYVPLRYKYRIKEGDIVDLQVKIEGTTGAPLPIEQKKFRGKITFIDPQIQPVAETAVRIYAEFENDGRELSPGLKGIVTLYLAGDGGAGVPAPTVGARTKPAGLLP
ncbi:MAG TPA: efflux RND transporter periplasmic adaptor subunit [Isosphaeraceae bacterium]|nr:efflux RND transporter periplasmic adaptor subunit [Isosphaeraceae bacterium]